MEQKVSEYAGQFRTIQKRLLTRFKVLREGGRTEWWWWEWGGGGGGREGEKKKKREKKKEEEQRGK